MAARVNGHDHLDSSVSTALPGSRDRVEDLREWYSLGEQLQRLLGGDEVSPFHPPRQVDESTALIAARVWRGAIRDVLRATARQQQRESE